MNFQKYTDTAKQYIEDQDKVYHTMCLVSDTANLLEKIKYFKGENSLLIAEIGDAIFRAFALLNKLEIPFDNAPIDLEDMKINTDSLNEKYPISEVDLLQSVIFELGIITNIVTENMKHAVDTIDEFDKKRLKNSIYSYILYMLILVCKFNFSVDKVLDTNLIKKKGKAKDLSHKAIKDGE